MPYLSPLTDAQASPETQGLFKSIQAAFKMVPNIFRTMGHSAPVLKATLDFNGAIQHDLDPKLRELAYLKASIINHCGYCQHYHKMGAGKAGVSEAQIAALGNYENSPAFTPLEKAVIRFADQWTAKGKAESAVVEELGKSLSPSQIIVLAAAVGLANWTNRFNETFAVELP